MNKGKALPCAIGLKGVTSEFMVDSETFQLQDERATFLANLKVGHIVSKILFV